MTESGRLCLEAWRARDAILRAPMTNEGQAEAGYLRDVAVAHAVEATGMDYDTIMARGEEELRLMEAEEG